MAGPSPAHRVASGFPKSRPHSSLFAATSFGDSARQPRDVHYEPRDVQHECMARLTVKPNFAPDAALKKPDSKMSRNLGRDGADSDESDESDESDDELRTPLFAHESFDHGPDSPDDECCHVTVKSPLKNPPVCLVEIDPNDPTIEKFPTETLSVLSTLRKIQSCHDDNSAHFNRRQIQSCHDDNSAHFNRRQSPSTDAVDSGRRSTSQASPKRGDKRVSHSALPTPTSCSALGAIAEEPKALGENDHDNGDSKHGQDGHNEAALHQGERHSHEATDSRVSNPLYGYPDASRADESKP